MFKTCGEYDHRQRGLQCVWLLLCLSAFSFATCPGRADSGTDYAEKGPGIHADLHHRDIDYCLFIGGETVREREKMN